MSGLGRLAVLGMGWAVLLPLTLFIVISREPLLEPPAPKTGTQFVSFSPVEIMTFNESTRATNIRTLGVQDLEMIGEVDRKMRRLDKYRRELEGLMLEHREVVANAFCPANLPVAYRAANVLLRGTVGTTQVVEPLTDELFGITWELTDSRDIEALFERWERRDERRHEDTAMALTALIGGRAESAAAGREAPYRRVVSDGGDVEAVYNRYPELRDLMVTYVAHVQVMAEIVQSAAFDFGCAGALADE